MEVLIRDALLGVDLRIDGWDPCCRDAGVVVLATSRGPLAQPAVIKWTQVAGQVAAQASLPVGRKVR